MKNKIFTCALVFSVLSVLSSCGVPIVAQKVLQTSNKDVKVELLFEIDGCKVYRFYDSVNGSVQVPKYFTKCAGSSSVSWFESCGKNCVREVVIPTAYTK